MPKKQSDVAPERPSRLIQGDRETIQGPEGKCFINRFNSKTILTLPCSYHPPNFNFNAILPVIPQESGGYAIYAPGNITRSVPRIIPRSMSRF